MEVPKPKDSFFFHSSPFDEYWLFIVLVFFLFEKSYLWFLIMNFIHSARQWFLAGAFDVIPRLFMSGHRRPFNCRPLTPVENFQWQVAYTFDAGPNAVLISPNRKTAALLLQKLLYYFPPQDKDLSRCV